MKNINKYIVVALVLLVGAIPAFSKTQQQLDEGVSYELKYKTELFNMLMLGDMNIGMEKALKKNLSVVSNVHIFTNNEGVNFISNKVSVNPKYRLSFGVKAYNNVSLFGRNYGPNSMMGLFTQVQFGLNYMETNLIPSAEFWLGISETFSEVVYFDLRIGAGRFITEDEDINKVTPLVSTSVGIML